MKAAARENFFGIPRPVLLVSRGVIIEALRRRDVYVLLILSGIFALGALVMTVVGVENAATGTFLLNLGMSLAYYMAHILTILVATRQFPADLENRTIYPLLAKPLSRSRYLLGKWLAVSAVGVVAMFVLFLEGWIPAPKMESYDAGLLLQALLLYGASICMLAAFSILVSLIIPRGPGVIILLLAVFGGDKFVNFIRAQAGEGSLGAAVRWITAYVPNFAKFNLTTRYADGMAALSPGAFLGLVFLGGIYTAAALALSMKLFQRRSL